MVSPRRVYIIGFMGSGKSTAGKKLSAILGWQFIDLDKEIEREAGKPVNDIFSDEGEVRFRALEKETLRSLTLKNDTVISCGGGTPCHSNNIDFMLSTGTVVYLEMTPGQLKSRLEGSQGSRPLIKDLKGDELIHFISKKLSEREKYYRMASVIINGISLDINKLAGRIQALPSLFAPPSLP